MRLSVTLVTTFGAAVVAGATHGILLVSDQVDGVANPQLFDSYYENAVRDAGYTYVKWDHATRGSPTFEDLRQYKVIIWYTSTSGDAPASDPIRGSITLTPAEQDTLVRFLRDTPGNTAVMLSGMYIAWNCVADAVNKKQLYKPLFSDYLKLVYPQDNFYNWIKVEDDWEYEGPATCPIFKGKSYRINWRQHANYPDQLRAGTGGSPSAWWTDPDNQHHNRAVIYAQGDKPGGGKYRIVLWAGPFENVVHENYRAELMKNFLLWAGTSQVDVGPTSLGRVKAIYR